MVSEARVVDADVHASEPIADSREHVDDLFLTAHVTADSTQHTAMAVLRGGKAGREGLGIEIYI